MSKELRDPRVKVWPTSRIIMVSVVYVALATGAAWFSIGVALDRVEDMGHYQVEKTREFLGREKADELDEFMHGKSNEEAASDAAEAIPSGAVGKTPPTAEE